MHVHGHKSFVSAEMNMKESFVVEEGCCLVKEAGSFLAFHVIKAATATAHVKFT